MLALMFFLLGADLWQSVCGQPTRAAAVAAAAAASVPDISSDTTHREEIDLDHTASFTADDRTLHVHVVPHTHDDVGWLKTPKQYYYGFNNTIQQAAVKYIVDTSITALSQNPKRTFTYVESAFFSMWWDEQSDDTKSLVRKLVKDGQLSFVNGGWCMHDEAATHYMGMIDQTTLGHSFLKRELGVIPRVGWQLDPFGHSATQASLFSSKVGFDALYFGRIDYQDLKRRHDEQQCEGFWSASSNLDDTNIFWGLTGEYGGNYGPPPGFCFDVHCNDDYLIGQDEATVRSRLVELVKFLKVQSDRTKGTNIMLTMGEDFNYENALINYENMDKMVSSLLELQSSGKLDVASMLAPRFDKIDAFYSNPERYTDDKHKEMLVAQKVDGPYETKTDDFFPYSDCPNCFWTGYFASRPALKRLERVGSSFLLAARQIKAMDDDDAGSLNMLDKAMGTAQHHDAVSGTSKQHVAYDYAKQIQAGINDAATAVVETLRNHFAAFVDKGDLGNLAMCQLRNETVCKVTQRATQVSGTYVYIVVYNALAQTRSEYITVPVAVDAEYKVSKLVVASGDHNSWQDVSSVVIPNENYSGSKSAANYVLHFPAESIPAAGASVYSIYIVPGRVSTSLTPTYSRTSTSLRRKLFRKSNTVTGNVISDTFTVSNDQIKAVFSCGVLSSLCRVDDENACQSVHQEWGYYTSFDSSKHAKTKGDKQSSGAYIFRPSDPKQKLQILEPDPSKALVYKSDLVTEVHSAFKGGWIKQIIRMYSGQQHVEIEYTVGPIPIDDGLGKEVVTRFRSPINNKGIYYTDSNGREFMQRKRSFRPTWNMTEFQPVSGNYYPVNAAIYIEDEQFALSIANDRSQGGGSLSDGSIELMVHRRTLVDDSRGVGEPINETDAGMTHYPPYGDAKRIGSGLVVGGKHRVALSRGGRGASTSRALMDGAFSEPLVFAASAHQNVVFRSPSFSAIGASLALPENIMLITFARISSSATDRSFLIRLGHQYGKGEDDNLSNPVDIALRDILTGYEIVSITEKTLSGNQDLAQREKTKLIWDEGKSTRRKEMPPLHDEGKFTLDPMDIRTFEVKVRL